jgi:hypothetical protein
MVKAVTGIAAILLAFGAFIAPGDAFACASPDPIETMVVDVMQPGDEVNIVIPSDTAAVELTFKTDDGQEAASGFAFTRDEGFDTTFAIAAAAPLLFALLSIGAYAVSRRRG